MLLVPMIQSIVCFFTQLWGGVSVTICVLSTQGVVTWGRGRDVVYFAEQLVVVTPLILRSRRVVDRVGYVSRWHFTRGRLVDGVDRFSVGICFLVFGLFCIVTSIL